jgi:hypothetical protein
MGGIQTHIRKFPFLYFVLVIDLTAHRYSQLYYGYRCMFPTWKDWNLSYTRKGTLKKWTKSTMMVLAFGLAFLDQFQKRSKGVGLGANELVTEWFKKVLLGVASLSVKAQQKI